MDARKLLKYPDCAENYSKKKVLFEIQPFSLRLTSLIPCLAGHGRQVSWLPSGSRLRSRLVRHNDLRLQHQPRFFNSFLRGGKGMGIMDIFDLFFHGIPWIVLMTLIFLKYIRK